MKRYDVFKSEGGYAVALGIYLDCPVVGAMRWFNTEAKAAQYAQNHKSYTAAYDKWEENIGHMSYAEMQASNAPTKKDYDLDVGVTI